MKFNKPTLVTLTAPTCAGKDYLLRHLLAAGFSKIVSTTTRPPRAGEVDGVDYQFISDEESRELERLGLFAELIEFGLDPQKRPYRYGVTRAEMQSKLGGGYGPPIVILETKGLEKYKQLCLDNGWDIFKVFVSVREQVRIDRLNERTAADLDLACAKHGATSVARLDAIAKVVKSHSDRLMSITGDERHWQTRQVWDAIVPGDDITKALNHIEQGIKCRNSRNDAATT